MNLGVLEILKATTLCQRAGIVWLTRRSILSCRVASSQLLKHVGGVTILSLQRQVLPHRGPTVDRMEVSACTLVEMLSDQDQLHIRGYLMLQPMASSSERLVNACPLNLGPERMNAWDLKY